MLRRKLVVFILVIEWKEVLQGQKTMFQKTFQVVLKLCRMSYSYLNQGQQLVEIKHTQITRS